MTAAADPREAFREILGVNRLKDSPLWPIRLAFDPRSWAQAPVELVPIAKMRRTQRRVLKKYLNGKGNDTANTGKDRPWLVLADGWYWIADGHHRVTDALLAGEQAVEAYVRIQPAYEEESA
jgi:hypothetical protein